mmetsp:Transcript_32946/g.72556  ORF Transcript_32946/g.72556 Transcript_32946/m.72556 type:complete len:122 (-) Transcript_32946:1273-1638(-)|eukprot:CAMPEP_0173231682 /NCGR_PEP_ID=MMETSP1142-20121109/8525_1 /TAXON_ID=483371 /ORGANISM="non described non described, Strain CCMP2298" /LENGTH=121 /DNA_ID=CAMNT_0014161077 /DNA_START=52 /DNA_END=417 /DNA_ORIENTATION=+
MSGCRSASGLMCSHGSHMDEKIARPKMPKSALPPELRRKMGLAPRENEDKENEIYKAGSGVLAMVGSGKDGTFLKRGSSIPMSHRTSGAARMRGEFQGQKAYIPRAKAADGSIVGLHPIRK